MLPAKPILTFLIYAVLLRVLDGWASPPPLLAWAFEAYGLFLLVNYWGRVRPARMARREWHPSFTGRGGT
jgi:hypothetical protein